MQQWTPVKTNWGEDDIHTVEAMQRVENNLKHLKETPCDDFELIGRTGQGWFTSAATVNMFWVVKKIPARSSLYLREVSKCFPMPDGDRRYCLLRLTSAVSTPSNSQLLWYTKPDANPLVRWISSKSTRKYIEHYNYENLGLKLMTNPLYTNAYLEFVGQMLTPITGRHSPEDTLYMKFHIGYDDI
jgi:hypothetical protein